MGIVARRNVKKHQNSRFQPGVPESKLQIVMPGIIRVVGNDLWNESLHSKDGGCCLQLATGSALVPTMTNDLKDCHVLATAVRCKVPAIVTDNKKHFPKSSVAPYRSFTSHEFLVH